MKQQEARVIKSKRMNTIVRTLNFTHFFEFIFIGLWHQKDTKEKKLLIVEKIYYSNIIFLIFHPKNLI